MASSRSQLYPPWTPAYLIIGMPRVGTNLTFYTDGAPVPLSVLINKLRAAKTPAKERKCFVDMLVTVNVVSLAINRARLTC